jgi:hypothetical protein
VGAVSPSVCIIQCCTRNVLIVIVIIIVDRSHDPLAASFCHLFSFDLYKYLAYIVRLPSLTESSDVKNVPNGTIQVAKGI